MAGSRSPFPQARELTAETQPQGQEEAGKQRDQRGHPLAGRCQGSKRFHGGRLMGENHLLMPPEALPRLMISLFRWRPPPSLVFCTAAGLSQRRGAHYKMNAQKAF